jgi:hypothetical protein
MSKEEARRSENGLTGEDRIMEKESLIKSFIRTFTAPKDERPQGKDTPSESDLICLRHMQDIMKGQKRCEREERAFLFEG